jgi:hypothetical protein
MSNLPLSDEDRQTLESEVRQLVRERLNGVTASQPVVCGCTWPYWFQPCCNPPAPSTLTPIEKIEPHPDPTVEGPPLRIALFLNSQGDTLRMILWPWERPHETREEEPAPLRPDQMLVGLRINPEFEPNMWPKEIQGWAYCECGVGPVIHQENSQTWYKWLMLDEETASTIVFRKKTIFGMTDCGSFNPSQFWSVLGGWTITFDWLVDGGFQIN